MANAVIFVMGVDYPKKYPWVGQCLKAFLDDRSLSTYMVCRLTCFGDGSGDDNQSHSSFVEFVPGHKTIVCNPGVSPDVTYLGFNLEYPEWWQACFQDLSGSSGACNKGVVTNAIQADMQWLAAEANGVQQPTLRTLSIRMTSAEKQEEEERLRRQELGRTTSSPEPCCMPWIRSRHGCRPLPSETKMITVKSSSKHFKVCEPFRRRDVAVCFVFVAHEFGGGSLAELADEFKNVLEGVRRKVVFVPVSCDPENEKLFSQAFLLARLSGGFVVSPTHEIEMFPGKLVRLLESTILNSGLSQSTQLEQQIAKLLEEGCYLKSRAKVYSACDERAPVHEHLNAFVSYVMQRREEVPLTGHLFPNVDDVLASGSGWTPRWQTPGGLVQDRVPSLDQNYAGDLTLQHCLAQMQRMECTITQQALRIEELEETIRSEKRPTKRGKRGGKRVKPKTGSVQQDEPGLSSESEDLPCALASIPNTASDWSMTGPI